MEKIIVNTDGGARGNPGPAGIGVVVANEAGDVLKEHHAFLGNATNNFAEYTAVAVALKGLKKMFGKETKDIEFELRLDSELVQRQLSGQYQIKNPELVPIFIEIHNLRVSDFPHITFVHVRREANKHADLLANKAMDGN